MTKIARDTDKIYSKAVYCWSYHTTHSYRHCKVKTEKSLYKKKFCQIPFYSRVHAKHVLVTLYGYDALRDVHFTTGKNIKGELGKKYFPQQKYPYEVYFGENGIRKQVWVKKRQRYEIHWEHWGSLKRYIFPPEYQYDKHRRRHFAIALKRHRDKGITHFNNWYKLQFYGYRSGISKKALYEKRKEVNDALLQEIPSLRKTSRWYRTGDI